MDEGTCGFREPRALLEPGSQMESCYYESELTHVTSKETKKRSATLVYPNAALLASMAARLFCAAMVECTLGVVGGGASDLGLSGADPIVTEYWS